MANDPALIKNVTISKCAKTDDGWGASGTAKNTGTKDATYSITVFFTTTGATVIATAETKVDVKAGRSADWTAAATFTAAPEMRCVIRGVSG